MARMASTERRVQLVDAAIRAMARDGVAKTTTRSIVAEAGVSLSIFHYCFDSKQALLEAVIETIQEHSVAPVTTEFDASRPLRDTIRASLQTYWDHVVSNPAEHLLTYELTQYALREKGFEHLARRQYDGYGSAGAQFLEQLMVGGAELTVPVEVAGRHLAVLIDGLTLNHLVLGDAESAGPMLELAADQVAALFRPA